VVSAGDSGSGSTTGSATGSTAGATIAAGVGLAISLGSGALTAKNTASEQVAKIAAVDSLTVIGYSVGLSQESGTFMDVMAATPLRQARRNVLAESHRRTS